MPTTTSETKYTTSRTYTSNDSGKTWKLSSTTVRSYHKRQKTWPVSVKRAYPTDLFLSGTGRTVSSVLTNDSRYTNWSWSFPAYMYEDDLVHRLFPFSWATEPDAGIDMELVYNKIRDDVRQGAVNLAQNLVEYRKTAKLFVDLAKVVATKGKSLVKRHPQIRKGTLNSYSKDASAAYLQYVYGISPLCSDMADAYQQLRNRVNHPIFIQGVESRKATATRTGIMGPNSTVHQCQARWTTEKKVHARCQWRAYLNRSAVMSSVTAYGFTNPLSVGYELIPFSFVVDWWCNLGDVLASLDNLILVDKLYVINSRSTRVAKFLDVIPSKHATSGTAFQYTRTDVRNAPVQISRIATLKYKPSVSLRHVLNGTALLNALR